MNPRVQSLGQVTEFWLDPIGPFREETIQALQVSTALSRRQIEMALGNCFEELTEEKLRHFLTSSPAVSGGDSGTRRTTLHILPSNVFTAWVHGAVIALLLGHRCLLKPSAREPVFARAWQKSLEEIDPVLAEQDAVVSWDEKLLQESHAVVAYGSDETLQQIRSQALPGARFAGYGHKLSVGIIFQEALEESSTDALLDRARRDAEPFRLQGCLSPQILYVEDPQFNRWPELEIVVDVMPKIKPFTQWADVLRELGKFTPYLSCVGYAGSSERGAFLERELRGSLVSRVCPLGEMQRPPLSWPNSGIDLANLLHSHP